MSDNEHIEKQISNRLNNCGWVWGSHRRPTREKLHEQILEEQTTGWIGFIPKQDKCVATGLVEVMYKGLTRDGIETLDASKVDWNQRNIVAYRKKEDN